MRLYLASCALGLLAVSSLPAQVVISQVYGGGGNNGALLKNDYVELFNRSAIPVDFSGWSLQYASGNGSTWQKVELTGTLSPGAYYLVQLAAGGGGAGGFSAGGGSLRLQDTMVTADRVIRVEERVADRAVRVVIMNRDGTGISAIFSFS